MDTKKIDITLTKEEWSKVNLWLDSARNKNFERVSKEWFDELLLIVKPFYQSLYFSDDYSAMNIPHDSEHTLTIDRKYFRILVFSVGVIGYDFDVKIQTSKMAYDIIKKLESQGDDEWNKNRH
jgi:hypothetical protein